MCYVIDIDGRIICNVRRQLGCGNYKPLLYMLGNFDGFKRLHYMHIHVERRRHRVTGIRSPDQMPLYAASDLGLPCVPLTLSWVSM